MPSRFAMITWAEPGPVDPGFSAPPGWGNYPSQGPGFPTHPIAPGGQPPGIWGGAPSYPAHPIAPGGQPPGIWGGGNVPMPTPPIAMPPPPEVWPRPPGEGGPGGPVVAPPIYLPGEPPLLPSHPIVIPEPPEGGAGGTPEHPIAQPPGLPVHPIWAPDGYMIIWVPGYGFGIVPIDVSKLPHATPHK